MAESEQQEKMLSETIVKEAVGLGMKSPLRDSIVEAVDEAEGGPSGGGSSLPLAGALFGAGAAIGFLAGRQSPELEDTSLEDIPELEVIEDVVEEGTDDEETITEMTSETESEGDTESEGGSSRLLQLLLAVGAIAAVAVLRRRRSEGDEEEWEPIEEFEPATSDDMGESEDEASEETVEAEAETEDADEEEEEEE